MTSALPSPTRCLQSVLVACGLALTSTSAQTSNTTLASAFTPKVPVLAWQPCADPQQSGFQCATAQVPLDYRDPSAGSIKLAVIKHPATDQGRRVGSLFFNPGGPGGAGTEDLPTWFNRFPDELQQKINEAKVSELLRLVTDKAKTPQEIKIIVKTLSKIGLCNEAERVTSSIQEFVPREEALANVAITLAQLGDTPNAERILKNLKQNWLRVEILKVLVVELTDTNYLQSNAFLSEALQEAESIKEIWRQSKTLGDLAVALIQAGCAQESEMIFSKAKEKAQAAINFWFHPNGQTRSNESEVYRWLSEAFAKAERFTEALSIFSSIEASAIYSSQELETFLSLLVNWAGDFESAEKKLSLTVLQEAVRIAGWVNPQWQDIYELMRF